jgi:hypothetical protein
MAKKKSAEGGVNVHVIVSSKNMEPVADEVAGRLAESGEPVLQVVLPDAPKSRSTKSFGSTRAYAEGYERIFGTKTDKIQ